MTAAPALKTAAMLALIFAAIMAACVWLLGCTKTQPEPVRHVGAVPAVAAQLSTVSAHVLRAQTILAVETTPAAALALGHLRVAAAALPYPDAGDIRRAEGMRAEELPVEVERAAGLAASASAALSDAAARTARTAAEDEFQRRERARAASWMLGAAGIAGGLATACAVARMWVPLASLLWSAGVLYGTAAALVLAARLVTHDWLVYALCGAFFVAALCGAWIAWRAWLATGPSSLAKKPA